jgi:beta-1,4-mannosyl-glycoprotein beta-1,4-N-acetylglucosaminyltransferase
MFFDELELLDLRFNYLSPIVDRFVLVESTKTFSLRDKPLFFEENKSLFSEFLPKIEHVVIEDFSDTDPWGNEKKQRNGIMRGLTRCSDEDIIICSDCDEIPRIEAMAGFDERGPLMGFKQDVYYYYFNGLTNMQWCGSKLSRYKDLVKASPYEYRQTCLGGTDLMIFNGGWHFSYLGSPEKIARKIQAFSHQEYNLPEFTDPEKIQERVNDGADIFSRENNPIRYVPLDSSFPWYLLENRDKFKHLVRS